MAVIFHPHALIRMRERGATEEDVIATIEHGEKFPVKFGRTGFRRNFVHTSERDGKHFMTKQLEVIAVKENDWHVITVIVKLF